MNANHISILYSSCQLDSPVYETKTMISSTWFYSELQWRISSLKSPCNFLLTFYVAFFITSYCMV